MTCEACGSPLPADVGFCPVCAAPVPERPAPAPSEEPAEVEVERPSLWRRLTGRGRRGAADAPPPAGAAVPGPPPSAPPPSGPPVTAPPPGADAPVAAAPPAPLAPPLSGPTPVPVEPSAPSGPIISAVPGFSRPAEPVAPGAPPEPPAALTPPAPPDEPPQPPAAPPATAAPVEPTSGDDAPAPDEATVQAEPDAPGGDDVDRTRLAAPADRPETVLVLPGGERLTVTGDGVLGRNPAAPVGEHVTHLVPVADPTRSVSKTHLAFGVDPVGLWVKDLHSTNGTAVVSPDGTRSLLTPGLAVHVMPGDVVVVGDVEVEVTR